MHQAKMYWLAIKLWVKDYSKAKTIKSCTILGNLCLYYTCNCVHVTPIGFTALVASLMSPVASLVTTDRCSNVSMCLRISTKCFLFPGIVPLLYSVGNKTYYYYYYCWEAHFRWPAISISLHRAHGQTIWTKFGPQLCSLLVRCVFVPLRLIIMILLLVTCCMSYCQPWCWNGIIPGELGDYPGRWCPGSLSGQVISSHAIAGSTAVREKLGTFKTRQEFRERSGKI